MRTFIALDLPPDFADDGRARPPAERVDGALPEARHLPPHARLPRRRRRSAARCRDADALEAACASVPSAAQRPGKFGRATRRCGWASPPHPGSSSWRRASGATGCVPATPSMPAPSAPHPRAASSRTSACRTWRFPKTTGRADVALYKAARPRGRRQAAARCASNHRSRRS